jgi:hypothetical protein
LEKSAWMEAKRGRKSLKVRESVWICSSRCDQAMPWLVV